MSYTKTMATDITFQLNTAGASPILTDLAKGVVARSAAAVAGRAVGMYSSVTKEPVQVTVNSVVGVVPRGRGKRTIATVVASSNSLMHGQLLEILVKSKDAGRI